MSDRRVMDRTWRGDRLRLYSLRRGVSHRSGPEKSQAIKLPSTCGGGGPGVGNGGVMWTGSKACEL